MGALCPPIVFTTPKTARMTSATAMAVVQLGERRSWILIGVSAWNTLAARTGGGTSPRCSSYR